MKRDRSPLRRPGVRVRPVYRKSVQLLTATQAAQAASVAAIATEARRRGCYSSPEHVDAVSGQLRLMGFEKCVSWDEAFSICKVRAEAAFGFVGSGYTREELDAIIQHNSGIMMRDPPSLPADTQ